MKEPTYKFEAGKPVKPWAGAMDFPMQPSEAVVWVRIMEAMCSRLGAVTQDYEERAVLGWADRVTAEYRKRFLENKPAEAPGTRLMTEREMAEYLAKRP